MEQNTLISLLPSELLNEICLHLDYIDISIIIKLFSVNINYQYLLSNKYPAFYGIVNDLKKHSLQYKNYSYDTGYDLMSLVEMQLMDNISNPIFGNVSTSSNIRTDNKEEFIDVVNENGLDVRELLDILAATDMLYLENIEATSYYKYREYFPNFENSNDEFTIACSEYSSNIQTIREYINDFEESTHYFERIMSLYQIFLYILDNKIDISFKERIQKLTFRSRIEEVERYTKERIIYLCIMKYINNLPIV